METKPFSEVMAAIAKEPDSAFRPCAIYNHEGDALEVYLENAPYLVERVDSLISVFVLPSNRDRVVGFAIKRIRKHFKDSGVSNVAFKHGRVTVNLLVHAARLGREVVHLDKGVLPPDEGSNRKGLITNLLEEFGPTEVSLQGAEELVGNH